MTIEDRFDLWQFTELKKLGKRAELIRNNKTGKLMVRCVFDAEGFEVFDAIRQQDNPNLMRVYDCVISDGKCESICEYINGETLDYAVASGRLFSEDEVRKIIAQLCDGLSVLHGFDIIHRDINPTNVMIKKNGTVKIIDYDIARTVKRGQSKDTQVLGTPGFAAPEQFGFSQTDERADIYSCGVLMNYLLTGKLPNEKLYFGNLTPVIQRCVEMDVDNRYKNTDELKLAVLGIKFGKRIKTQKSYINYSRLPGFRGRGFFLKFLTVLLIAAYTFFLVMYIRYVVGTYDSVNNPLRQILTGIDIFVLLSALPYFTLGDIGGLSRVIVKGKPQTGKNIFRIIGFSSLFLGFVLFLFIPSM